ncbi:hypothetical protein ANO11243_034470 [Dothideomycetidae sp. 11243]|nr:hypothetical protein ANO11243_034470 [fungal sp. No.11243]
MTTKTNEAAWLIDPGTPLQVDKAPMPTSGQGELVVRNFAVAINPLDSHMQGAGVFVQQWPSIIGCDIAGEVHEVGPGASSRFKLGDRVIGHCLNLVTGRPQDGAFALYTVVPANKAAILPGNISYTDGVVVPFALEAAVCALTIKEPGEAMPGVATPALGLPLPSSSGQNGPNFLKKVLVVYGGSSSVGSMTTQLATAAGVRVTTIAGRSNFELSKRSGAVEVIDRDDPDLVENVVQAVNSGEKGDFVGIFDAVSSAETYAHNLAILTKLGGGHLACVHPPPTDVPAKVKAGMIFAVNDAAHPVWRDFVTPALQAGRLQCLPPPTVVGKGLETVQDAIDKIKTGVSGTKLVVEL